jgi:hypothetical protein
MGGVLAALTALSLGVTAKADTVVGSQAIATLGANTANNADITLATSFFVDDMFSTAARDGDFLLIPSSQSLGDGTLTLGPGNTATFSFVSATFGTFTAATYVDLGGSGSVRNIFLLGTFTPGSDFPAPITDAGPASVIINFNQAGGPGTAIGASLTLSSPPVPEPGSIALCGIGLVALGGARFLKRKRMA